MRFLYASLLWLALACAGLAQDLTALARIDPGKSEISDAWLGGTSVSLHLSQGVPFRVAQLDEPYRLVVDFQEVDFAGLAASDLLENPGRVSAVRFGRFRPGWSRLVMDLTAPMAADDVAMRVDKSTGSATFTLKLSTVSEEAYAALLTPPTQTPFADQIPPPKSPSRDNFVVVIDPGHGGVDPGAVREGVSEKALMLDIALNLRDVLRRQGGIEVFLTRETDTFVSLPARISRAHDAHADVFISLHADALSQGRARGATIYTLSETASDLASEQLAAQHNRSDIIAGLDLSAADEQVLDVLLDLARQETAPRTNALADTLIDAMRAAGGPVNKRPRREAAFSVLKSADIPSVLVEIGFLSDKRDLANLRDPVWRAVMTEALADGILTWYQEDRARASLIRQ